MARIEPVSKEDVPELAELISNLEEAFGFLPNDFMTMARKPNVVRAFVALAIAINDPSGTVPRSLKRCVSYIAAYTVGCKYCQAITATFAAELDVPEDKIAAIWEYESSPLFDDAERAALIFAQAAASVPNAVTDDDFDRLRNFYDDEQIVEILLVVCQSAFFNRWNESLSTKLEDHASAFAMEHLAPSGWEPGDHV